MAKRRMFSLDVVDTDKFLDMPATTQALYFHLGMRADDDGFVSSPRKTAILCNCSMDDVKLLIAKGYVIPFQDGIIVIKHWKQCNWIRNERHKPTVYQKELKKLAIDNGEYFLVSDNMSDNMSDNPQPQYRTEQGRAGQCSIGQNRTETGQIAPDSVSDRYTLEEIIKCAKDNKVKLSDRDIQAFYEQIKADSWTMYRKPVDNLLRALREYAKKHTGDNKALPKKNKFHNFDQREYDYDDIERRLTQRR